MRRASSASSRPGSAPARERPGEYRGELEPAADLRVRRRARLPRPPASRHRLVRRCCRRRSSPNTSRTRAIASPTSRARYFPRTDRDFIPQQTYDQVLYQLGLVGLRSARLRRRWRALARPARLAAGPGVPTRTAAYVPSAGWRRGTGGALAGAALFGGSPLTASSGSRSASSRRTRPEASAA